MQNADSIADLGVIKTCDFRYNDHANQICLKVSRLARIIYSVQTFFIQRYSFLNAGAYNLRQTVV